MSLLDLPEEHVNKHYHLLKSYTQPVQRPNRKILGRDNEIEQVMAALVRPELCNVMLIGDPGLGKAHPVDTLVAVHDERGFIQLKDIQVGDLVYDENGFPCSVTGVFPQGQLEVYKITFRDGSEILCNDQHLWAYKNEADIVFEGEDFEWTVGTLAEMQILMQDPNNEGLAIPVGGALRRKAVKLGTDPYDYALNLGNRYYEGNLNLTFTRMHLESSIEQRKALFKGLLDSKLGADLSSYLFEVRVLVLKHGALVKDIAELINSLGMRFSTYLNKDKDIIFKIYKPFNYSLGVSSIEKMDYKTEMLCIQVNSSSHLYQIGKEHIVTHNTALVQGCMLRDTKREYLEVNLADMIADVQDSNQMASILRAMFAQATKYREEDEKELVLFIDEFHQIVSLSTAAAEALKPILADSGVRGIKVIAATTTDEFIQWIRPNLPLQERLQRINLPPLSKEVCISILQDMAVRYDVDNQFYDDQLFEKIYEYTNRFIPSSVQPRKSIKIFDSMIGWHRATGRKFDDKLLADVIYESENVQVNFDADASKIKESLDKVVFAQDYATQVIEERLQTSIAGLNDPNKPMATLLFTGSTGTGKSLRDDAMIPVWTSDGSKAYKRNGDLEVGDYVFSEHGKPIKVLGVFPQGEQDVYRLSFGDGRYVDASADHLWSVYKHSLRPESKPIVLTTLELLNSDYLRHYEKRKNVAKYSVKMNAAVEWPFKEYEVDPYVVGAFIGNGCLTLKALQLSSDDEFVVNKVADLIGSKPVSKPGCYSWFFENTEAGRAKYLQTRKFFETVPGLTGVYSADRRLPETYMQGSIEQRWALIHGLFDTDGSISRGKNGRRALSYSSSSIGLLEDIQRVLWSLGVSSSLKFYERKARGKRIYNSEGRLIIKVPHERKADFFTLPRKKEVAFEASQAVRTRRHNHDFIKLAKIEKLPEKAKMTCIYVDSDSHLYLTDQFVVTHNTEVSKQLTKLLFGEDDRRLIRFDMSEYANPDSLERFRIELTNRVWARPYCILLFDEIEKACRPVTLLLLQVLDDGRLIDINNREVNFSNAYIIMTTNTGSEIYEQISRYNVSDVGSAGIMDEYESLIRESLTHTSQEKFPVELLGRINAIVPFQPLSENTLIKIARLKLDQLRKRVRDLHGIKVRVTERVLDFVVKEKTSTDANQGGARRVVNNLERYVFAAIARHINEHPQEKNIAVDIRGRMRIDHKDERQGDAYVVVGPIKARRNNK